MRKNIQKEKIDSLSVHHNWLSNGGPTATHEVVQNRHKYFDLKLGNLGRWKFSLCLSSRLGLLRWRFLLKHVWRSSMGLWSLGLWILLLLLLLLLRRLLLEIKVLRLSIKLLHVLVQKLAIILSSLRHCCVLLWSFNTHRTRRFTQ